MKDKENRIQDLDTYAKVVLLYIRPFGKHAEADENMPDYGNRQYPGDYDEDDNEGIVEKLLITSHRTV